MLAALEMSVATIYTKCSLSCKPTNTQQGNDIRHQDDHVLSLLYADGSHFGKYHSLIFF